MLSLKKFKEKLFLRYLERKAKSIYKIRPANYNELDRYEIVCQDEYGWDIFENYSSMSFKEALEALNDVREKYIERRIKHRKYWKKAKELEKY